MKGKICVICLLLISVYCLSAVCAADLNQTADDIKTNDENDGNAVLVDDDVCDISCEDVTVDDVSEVEMDSDVNDNLGCSEFNYVPQEHPKKELKPCINIWFNKSPQLGYFPYLPFISVPIHKLNITLDSNENGTVNEPVKDLMPVMPIGMEIEFENGVLKIPKIPNYI